MNGIDFMLLVVFAVKNTKNYPQNNTKFIICLFKCGCLIS